MPQNTKEERYRWIKPILNKETTIKEMAGISPFSERTLKNWLKSYKEHGIYGLEPKNTKPKTQPGETPIWLKEKIVKIRKDTGKCALKLRWDLEDEGIHIHERTIGKIIKNEGLTRKYRTKRVKYKYIKSQLKPGELVEIDVKYVPQKLAGERYYQYTAIDAASRWRHIAIYDQQTNYHSILFLKEIMRRFPYKIRTIKTDNHSVFTNRPFYLRSSDPVNARLHPFDVFCSDNRITHYLIDKGKPAQNGTVERSHREDQEKFYDKLKFGSEAELKYKARLWNMYYNDLKHIGLNGLTPNEALGLSKRKVQNVYT